MLICQQPGRSVLHLTIRIIKEYKMKKISNSLIITILLMSLVLISCEKTGNNDICNVSDPVEDLDWLRSAIEENEQSDSDLSRYIYYMTAKYDGKTVFFNGNCHPAVNYVSFVLDCNGDTLGNTNDLYDELTDIHLLWKHEESECNFN